MYKVVWGFLLLEEEKFAYVRLMIQKLLRLAFLYNNVMNDIKQFQDPRK